MRLRKLEREIGPAITEALNAQIETIIGQPLVFGEMVVNGSFHAFAPGEITLERVMESYKLVEEFQQQDELHRQTLAANLHAFADAPPEVQKAAWRLANTHYFPLGWEDRQHYTDAITKFLKGKIDARTQEPRT